MENYAKAKTVYKSGWASKGALEMHTVLNSALLQRCQSLRLFLSKHSESAYAQCSQLSSHHNL